MADSLVLKFEQVHNDDLYAITINPDDEHQYWGSEDRIGTFYNKLSYKLIIEVHNTCQLELYPEFSSRGRLHFHGTIKMLNKIEFYEQVLRRLMKWCQLEIDTINDQEAWKKYYIKQQDLHNYYRRKEHPIPLVIGTDFKKMTVNFFNK